MKSSEKMLSWEEYRDGENKKGILVGPAAREAWFAARQGMMPITEAVGFEEWDALGLEIMPKNWGGMSTAEKWKYIWKSAQAALLADHMVIDLRGVWDKAPDWASEIEVRFLEQDTKKSCLMFQTIITIPRPKPSWHPKEGEHILLNIEGVAVEVVYSGKYSHLRPENMRQHDPAKIGLSWEEI